MNSLKSKVADTHLATSNSDIITVDDDELQQNSRANTGSKRKPFTTTGILNSFTNKKADKIGHRRRKTFHKILNADDEITFESVIPDHNSIQVEQRTPVSKPDQEAEQSPLQKLNKNNCTTDKSKTDASYSTENPNTEFIQRVAFLRSCVNYMLKNSGKEVIDFKYGNNTLSALVNNYTTVANEAEEIVLSD